MNLAYIMKKTQQYVEKLTQQWKESFSKLVLEAIGNSNQQGYSAKYVAGTLYLRADNPLGAVFGISQLNIGSKSGHLAEFLGNQQPRYPIRPLWVRNPPEDWDLFCTKVIEWGFNAVVVEDPNLVDLVHGYGLKLILKSNEIVSRNVDFLFFESQMTGPSKDRDATQADLVLSEVRKIESELSSAASLIFYIPAVNLQEARKHSTWFESICDDVGNKTMISFSAEVDGDPHPFWEVLRRSPDTSATPLLPVINQEHFISRCYRHNFAGVITCMDHLSDEVSWITSQLLWRQISPELASETWNLSKNLSKT